MGREVSHWRVWRRAAAALTMLAVGTYDRVEAVWVWEGPETPGYGLARHVRLPEAACARATHRDLLPEAFGGLNNQKRFLWRYVQVGPVRAAFSLPRRLVRWKLTPG